MLQFQMFFAPIKSIGYGEGPQNNWDTYKFL